MLHRLMLPALAVTGLAACLDMAPAPAESPRDAGGNMANAGAADTVGGAQLDLRLDALTSPRPTRAAARRNPFRFAGRRDADAAAAGRAAAIPPAGDPLARSRDETATAGTTGAGLRLRFIALVDAPRSAGLIAVLSDGETVFQGRAGDTIDGRYRIMSIDSNAAEVELLLTGERRTLHRDGT